MNNQVNAQAKSSAANLRDELRVIVGNEYVLTDASSCLFYSQDVYSRGIPVLAVAQPANIEELAALVACAVVGGMP